jgi:hypothetical protein
MDLAKPLWSSPWWTREETPRGSILDLEHGSHWLKNDYADGKGLAKPIAEDHCSFAGEAGEMRHEQ